MRRSYIFEKVARQGIKVRSSWFVEHEQSRDYELQNTKSSEFLLQSHIEFHTRAITTQRKVLVNLGNILDAAQ